MKKIGKKPSAKIKKPGKSMNKISSGAIAMPADEKPLFKAKPVGTQGDAMAKALKKK